MAFLTRIKAQPNVRIETAATVVALTNKPDSPRVIDGVRLADGRLFQARRIVLAGGAMHSPRLLQDHVDDHGLNAELPAAALIGRRYKCHLNSALVAVSFGRKNDLLRKTVLLLNQRYPHSSVQNQGGVMDGDMIATQMPALMPHWVSEQIGRRAYAFWLTTEDGSHVDNRVVSRSNGSRLPMLDYDPRRLPEALDEHRRLCRGMAQALWRQGYATVVKHMPLEATAHACGTLATGRDATQGVVDARGAVFGMDNLFVADGSALPRSSRVNPALTIYAWGLRVAANLDLEQAA